MLKKKKKENVYMILKTLFHCPCRKSLSWIQTNNLKVTTHPSLILQVPDYFETKEMTFWSNFPATLIYPLHQLPKTEVAVGYLE